MYKSRHAPDMPCSMDDVVGDGAGAGATEVDIGLGGAKSPPLDGAGEGVVLRGLGIAEGAVLPKGDMGGNMTGEVGLFAPPNRGVGGGGDACAGLSNENAGIPNAGFVSVGPGGTGGEDVFCAAGPVKDEGAGEENADIGGINGDVDREGMVKGEALGFGILLVKGDDRDGDGDADVDASVFVEGCHVPKSGLGDAGCGANGVPKGGCLSSPPDPPKTGALAKGELRAGRVAGGFPRPNPKAPGVTGVGATGFPALA